MGCLGAVSYDPTSAVSKATDTLLAMTALDTTNLRITFTAPSNGTVMVRLKGQTHGATTYPRILLGVLDGSTVMGRMSPLGWRVTALATTQVAQEVSFLVSGLTPSNSYTWDAAYSVELVLASTALKYGGPDNATTDDAFGAFQFEIWETANLLAGVHYDPSSSTSKVLTSLLAMTAFDTTNLRHTITAPASGRVFWRLSTMMHGSTTVAQPALGIMEGSTVVARTAPLIGSPQTAVASANYGCEATGVITGLTPSSVHTYDAAYGVEIIGSAGSAFKYGGPNDTTSDNAYGGIAYEFWEA